METWIELAGLTLRSPVTAFTNLFLSFQCAIYYRRLRTGALDRGGYWSLFFLAMAGAMLAGVPKHGFGHMLSGGLYSVMLWVSNLGSGAAVYFAQRATLASRAGASPRGWSPPANGRVDWVRGLCTLQAAVYLGANTLFGPEMVLSVVNTAVGLIPVIFAEGWAFRRGHARGAWIVAGLAVSMLTGVAYLGRVSFGVWFNHIDLAHVLMGVSFSLLLVGAPGSSSEGPAEPSRSGREAVSGLAATYGRL